MATLHKDAPKLVVKPLDLCGFQEKTNWLPVCQYPISFDVDNGEQGSVVKMNRRGEVTDVIRRVFC